MQDVLSRALFMQTQQILWETPEVTTAAKAACQPASNCLNHRFATVVTSSSSHRVRGVWRSGVVHAGCFESGAVHANAAHPVGDAGGHDGSEGGVSVSIELPEPPLRHCRNLQQLPPGPGCLEVGRCACGMFDLLTDPPYSRASSLHITTRQSLITGAAVRTQPVGASSIALHKRFTSFTCLHLSLACMILPD
jgi:hypothetical protein